MDILVTCASHHIETLDGLRMRVRRVQVQHAGYCGELNAAIDYGTVHEVAIFQQRWFDVRRIALQDGLAYAISKYLTCYYGQQFLWYDCYAFACEVAGVALHEKTFLHEFWDTTPLKRAPRLGDVVFLCDTREHFFSHAAICLFGKLFVSVYGGGGDIEFSTLEDMKREFAVPDVLLGTPRLKSGLA